MSQARVRVSIVIPAYNEERHLKASLRAIANQTQPAYQTLVVNNASTDNTAAIASGFPFVTVLHEERKGIVFARNRGFNAATGDIIARIDADTILPPNWIEHVQQFYADSQNASRVLTGGCRFYNLLTGRLTGHGYNFFVHRSNRLLLGYYLPWGSNMALPRMIWQTVAANTCARTDIHEDLDLGIHLHKAGFEVRYLPWLRVQAVARRIMTDHKLLWPYMLMWPRTFRIHNISRFTSFCTLLMAGLVWLGSIGVYVTEKITRLITGKTINY